VIYDVVIATTLTNHYLTLMLVVADAVLLAASLALAVMVCVPLAILLMVHFQVVFVP
jgi:hypothetical protein